MTDKEQKHEKPKIDPKTLSGLGGVKQESLKTNPKILTYRLFDKTDPIYYSEATPKENPTVFKIDDILPKEFIDKEISVEIFIYAHAQQHMKKYGTLKELWIEGHGSKLSMGDNNNKSFDIMFFINTIDLVYGNSTNSKGVPKIADRIIFDGCSTFEKLTDDEIKKIRKVADKYDIEIVGTTSSVVDKTNAKKDIWGKLFDLSFYPFNSQLDGRYVQFTPTGDVIRDKLDTRFGINSLFEDRSWIDYHLNQSQATGENLRNNQQKHEQKIKDFWLNKGKRGIDL